MTEPTQSLAVADPSRFQPVNRSETEVSVDLSMRHRFVLELHLAGYSIEEISDLSNYSKPAIYRILKRDDVQSLKQQFMSYVDEEFSNLYPSIVNELKDLLTSQDEGIRLKAVQTWLKYHKKSADAGVRAGDSNSPQIGKVSAEQVIVNILNQGTGT